MDLAKITPEHATDEVGNQFAADRPGLTEQDAASAVRPFTPSKLGEGLHAFAGDSAVSPARLAGGSWRCPWHEAGPT